MAKELVKVNKPQLPKKWDYGESIKIGRQLFIRWKDITSEMAEHFFIAREMLRKWGGDKKSKEYQQGKSPVDKDWGDYCQEVSSIEDKDNARRAFNGMLTRFYEPEKLSEFEEANEFDLFEIIERRMKAVSNGKCCLNENRTGLEFKNDISYGEWWEIGKILSKLPINEDKPINEFDGAIPFWAGDWVNYGERIFGSIKAIDKMNLREAIETARVLGEIKNKIVEREIRAEREAGKHLNYFKEKSPEVYEFLMAGGDPAVIEYLAIKRLEKLMADVKQPIPKED